MRVMTLERDIKFDYSIESFNISINMTKIAIYRWY
jgi:hypothetical protein